MVFCVNYISIKFQEKRKKRVARSNEDLWLLLLDGGIEGHVQVPGHALGTNLGVFLSSDHSK